MEGEPSSIKATTGAGERRNTTGPTGPARQPLPLAAFGSALVLIGALVASITQWAFNPEVPQWQTMQIIFMVLSSGGVVGVFYWIISLRLGRTEGMIHDLSAKLDGPCPRCHVDDDPLAKARAEGREEGRVQEFLRASRRRLDDGRPRPHAPGGRVHSRGPDDLR